MTLHGLSFPLLLTCLLMQALATVSASAAELVGQRLKLSGLWNGRELMVHRVKYRDPSKSKQTGQIAGLIEAVDLDNQRIKIGPAWISWNDKTRFKQLSVMDLKKGAAVKVGVSMTQSGPLMAYQIKPGAAGLLPNEIELVGAVLSVAPMTDSRNRLIILGIPASVPEQLTNPTLQLTRRQDDARPEDQISIDIFGRPLIIGGEFGLTPRFDKDLRLDPSRDDDRFRIGGQLQLELFYAPTTTVALFLEGLFDGEIEPYREGGRDKTVERRLRRGESWLFWGDIADSGVSFQIGRQNFQDRREWWWDENLDAVRLYFTQPFFHFEVGAAERAGVLATDDEFIDPKSDKVLRILSHGHWQWHSQHALDLFFLHQLDHSSDSRLGRLVDEDEIDDSDVKLTWGGVRATGKQELGSALEVEYWLDSAWVGGREILTEVDDTDKDNIKRVDAVHRRNLLGWAIDAGLIFETDLPGHPTFTASYAFGSREFRQTGLQDNNARFRGVDRFRYYGELLRPELANLHIWTLSVGLPLLRSSSVELLLHHYRQVDARPLLRNARLRANPTGKKATIGQELDLVVGLEEWKQLELEFVFGAFRAGPAYGRLEGKTAFNLTFKLNYNF